MVCQSTSNIISATIISYETDLMHIFLIYFRITLTKANLTRLCHHIIFPYHSCRAKFDLPSPSAVCSHPLARLSVPTHNAQPDNEMTLKKKGNIRAFSSYGQGSGYDRTVRLVAVRRLRIINIMIGM